MSDVVIRTEGLGKQYSIHHEARSSQPSTFREAIHQGVQKLFSRAGGNGDRGDEKLWVLQDLDLEINRGEVVGIIGRNGAGKSTLLKILSRITEPTSGRATVRGRVASLLEVGTGFHPELTGRENIFLNGSILGMSRQEIRSKFDEIVAFSGVEKFLDTPVKRYSSGMYVRLAFSVASHLEPDILIVDEVLAVGDMDFQRKCLGRLGEVSKEGRTVLFVSHNLPMVSSLCEQCVLLENGRLVSKGATPDILPLYHGASLKPASRTSAGANGTTSKAGKSIQLDGAWVSDRHGQAADQLSLFDDVFLHVKYVLAADRSDAIIPFFHLFDEKGEYVLLTFPHDWPHDQSNRAGVYEATCHLPAHFLNAGAYSVSVQVNSVVNGHALEFFEEHALRFVITDNILSNPHRAHTKFSYEIPGVVRPLLEWNVVPATKRQSGDRP